MGLKVTCNKCRGKFEINLLTRKIGELTSIYFRCPLCKAEYHSYFENDKSLSLQQDINNLNQELKNPKLENWQRVKMLKNLHSLKVRKKKILEGLNKKKSGQGVN